MTEEANQVVVPEAETPAEPNLDTVLEGFGDEEETTEPVETPVAEPEGEGATEPTEFYTVTVDGAEQQVSLEDMKRDYSFRKHNEQRAAELNRQQEENEATRRMLEYAGYSPQAQTQFQQPQPQVQQFQPGQEQIEFVTPTEEMLYRELQTVKQSVGAITEQSQNQRLQAVIQGTQKTWDDFRSSHDDLDETALAARLEVINQNELPLTEKTLDLVHKSFMDEETVATQAVADYQEKLRKNKGVALEPSTESGHHAPPNVKDMADDDIIRLASQDTWEEEY